jgi:hypothetical protein
MDAVQHIRQAPDGWRSGAILAAVLLTLAISLCLFHADDHRASSHAMSADLCVGLFIASLTVTLLAGLPLTGWAPGLRTVRVPAISLRIPAPPPKRASR